MIDFLLAMILPLVTIIVSGFIAFINIEHIEGIEVDICVKNAQLGDKLFIYFVIAVGIIGGCAVSYMTGIGYGRAELDNYKQSISETEQRTTECKPLSYNKTLGVCVDKRYIKEVK